MAVYTENVQVFKQLCVINFETVLRFEKDSKQFTNEDLENYVLILTGIERTQLNVFADVQAKLSGALETISASYAQQNDDSLFVIGRIKHNVLAILNFLVRDRGYKLNVGNHLFTKREVAEEAA